jgi:hypothetical protein
MRNEHDEVVSGIRGENLMGHKTRTIRDLNGVFRRNPRRHGRLVITAGVLAEGTQFVDKRLQTVRSFDVFNNDSARGKSTILGRFRWTGSACSLNSKNTEAVHYISLRAESPHNGLFCYAHSSATYRPQTRT